MATCERLSEAYLVPVIKAMLEGFPFTISGFHVYNGSEHISHQVAGRLEKLRIELTRSRPRHSNDNGLAETKNGAVGAQVLRLQPHPGALCNANQRLLRRPNPYLTSTDGACSPRAPLIPRAR